MDDYDLITGPVQSPSIVLAIVLLVSLCGLAVTLYSEYLRSRLRFRLRTLLIATTVIAVVLGIIVLMKRAG
jgi:hypothetical protein